MASPTRLRIMRLLARPKRHFADQWSADPEAFGVCMTLIAQKLAVAQPTASRHLEILRQAGFIIVRRHQKWSYCQRDEAALQDYLTWLGHELSSPGPPGA